MRLLKWLLLQMLQTRITCSKKKKVISPSFFCYNTPQKRQRNIKMLPKCCQNRGLEKKKNS